MPQLDEVPAIINTALNIWLKPARGPSARLCFPLSQRCLRITAITSELVTATRHYAMSSANNLRSLPIPSGGRRSMFRPDGLVAGSERLERFLLWPTGVQSPGAMRQWGRHAIAFADRRHFDDPELYHQIFGR